MSAPSLQSRKPGNTYASCTVSIRGNSAPVCVSPRYPGRIAAEKWKRHSCPAFQRPVLFLPMDSMRESRSAGASEASREGKASKPGWGSLPLPLPTFCGCEGTGITGRNARSRVAVRTLPCPDWDTDFAYAGNDAAGPGAARPCTADAGRGVGAIGSPGV